MLYASALHHPVMQAKDLPIGEIVQKATLKKVLLSEQKVRTPESTPSWLHFWRHRRMSRQAELRMCTHRLRIYTLQELASAHLR